MEKQNRVIVLTAEEIYITGLAEVFDIDSIEQAFKHVRNARQSCMEHYERILERGPALRTDKDRLQMPSYEARIKKLDDISFDFGLLSDDIFECNGLDEEVARIFGQDSPVNVLRQDRQDFPT